MCPALCPTAAALPHLQPFPSCLALTLPLHHTPSFLPSFPERRRTGCAMASCTDTSPTRAARLRSPRCTRVRVGRGGVPAVQPNLPPLHRGLWPSFCARPPCVAFSGRAVFMLHVTLKLPVWFNRVPLPAAATLPTSPRSLWPDGDRGDDVRAAHLCHQPRRPLGDHQAQEVGWVQRGGQTQAGCRLGIGWEGSKLRRSNLRGPSGGLLSSASMLQPKPTKLPVLNAHTLTPPSRLPH